MTGENKRFTGGGRGAAGGSCENSLEKSVRCRRFLGEGSCRINDLQRQRRVVSVEIGDNGHNSL